MRAGVGRKAKSSENLSRARHGSLPFSGAGVTRGQPGAPRRNARQPWPMAEPPEIVSANGEAFRDMPSSLGQWRSLQRYAIQPRPMAEPLDICHPASANGRASRDNAFQPRPMAKPPEIMPSSLSQWRSLQRYAIQPQPIAVITLA